MSAETICTEAERVVHGGRREDYGHPRDNHSRTAALWSAYLDGRRTEGPLSPEEVCFMNILQKIARSQQRITRDTLVDICGFAANVAILAGFEE